MTTEKHTFCRICEPSCPMLAEINEQGKVVKLKPDPDHPCGGTACNKGLSFLQLHNDPDRLNGPMKRMNPRTEDKGDFARISWDDAFAEIGEKLRAIREKYGPDSIALYFGNPIGWNSRPLPHLFDVAQHIPTRMLFNPLTQDCSNTNYVAGEIYGSPNIWMVPDLYHTDYLLCIGANPKVSHWTLVSVPNDNGKVLKDIKARGGKVRFVNPRKIESSTVVTGETLQIKPSADVYFLAAVLNEIHECGGFKKVTVERYGKNVDQLIEFIKQYPADRVAGVTGIAADTIREVAGELMVAKSASVYTATGVNQGRQGVLTCWLSQMINFVTGNLGKEGGTYLPDGFYGRWDAPTPLPEDEVSIDTSVGTLKLTHNYLPLPTPVLPELINNGDIKAMVVICGNPLLAVPGEAPLREAFNKLEALVTIDINRTETSELADYVLASTDWLEREDIISWGNGNQLKPYVQYTEAMEKPHEDRRDDWWIWAKIGLEFGPHSALEAELEGNGFVTLNQMLSTTNLSVEKLKEMSSNTAMIEQSAKEGTLDKIMTKDGKVNCCPQGFVEAGLFDRCAEIFDEHVNESSDALKLISMRTIHMHNSWLSNMPMFRKGINNTNSLNMNEADAIRLGLFDGDSIRVFNNHGEIQTQLLVNNDLMPGVVSMTHGFGHKNAHALKVSSNKPGANYNQLLPMGHDGYEPRSHMAWMNGVQVQVEKIPF